MLYSSIIQILHTFVKFIPKHFMFLMLGNSIIILISVVRCKYIKSHFYVDLISYNLVKLKS